MDIGAFFRDNVKNLLGSANRAKWIESNSWSLSDGGADFLAARPET
jgi:hypothetical protein